MATDKPQTVTVEAIKSHSYNGKTYDVGDTYEIDAQYVESVANQGMAVRADRVAHARAEKKAADETLKARARAAAVGPMTTADAPVATGKRTARKAASKK